MLSSIHSCIVWLMCGFLSLFIGCSEAQNEQKNETSNEAYSKTELVQLMKSKDAVTILDVRTSDEISQGMIPGAMHVDYYSEDFSTKLKSIDSNKPVIVYCKSGGRAGKAKAELEKLGHRKVYNFGGYEEWVQINKK